MCIAAALKPFHKKEAIQIKRGQGQIGTTVKMEVVKQIEIYLSNARVRILRKEKIIRINWLGTFLPLLASYSVLMVILSSIHPSIHQPGNTYCVHGSLFFN